MSSHLILSLWVVIPPRPQGKSVCSSCNTVENTGMGRNVMRGGGKDRDKKNNRDQLDVYLAWSIINWIISRNIYPRKCTERRWK